VQLDVGIISVAAGRDLGAVGTATCSGCKRCFRAIRTPAMEMTKNNAILTTAATDLVSRPKILFCLVCFAVDLASGLLPTF